MKWPFKVLARANCSFCLPRSQENEAIAGAPAGFDGCAGICDIVAHTGATIPMFGADSRSVRIPK
jgi:hypothetical protein